MTLLTFLQAMFNLGLMHQFGTGLPRDLHLAKRYYDMALSTSKDAYLPATLALTAMNAASFLETLIDTNYAESLVSKVLQSASQLTQEYSGMEVRWEDLTWENTEKFIDVCLKSRVSVLHVDAVQTYETELILALVGSLILLLLARRLQ
jgi:SEL1 protein